MDLDRLHHRTTTTTTTSELFICFPSRISSSASSMKLSKSILSPSHARHEPPHSLPPSLSRRLKANGSIKGGQSPATFPTITGKKRGSGFDNPEPSSPKVTCIGQVKMKTKKKVRQSRSLSNRSFRKVEQAAPEERHFQPQDQCVAVAAAHRNQRWVHLPLTIYEALREFSCLFPCFSRNEKEKETKVNEFREINSNNNGERTCGDVVARWLVTLQDGEAEKMEEMRSSRRHVFEGIEFKDHESVELKEESVEEEEKGRVSICIPPKNALLLMRCRSDPMKMADITNRFWESPTLKETDTKQIGVAEETSVFVDVVENEENVEAVQVMEMESKDSFELTPKTEKEDEEESETKAVVAAETNSIEQVAEKEEESNIQNSNGEFTEEDDEKFKSAIEKEIEETLLLGVKQTYEQEEDAKCDDTKESRKQQNESILPDCLLLTMCKPKLYVEVSKETCTEKKNKEIFEPNNSQHLPLQPPRSSCSFPVTGVPPATMIEQKLGTSFVLTRCKSEPMRAAATAAKLEPETCFWKNRNIEPHRRATFGFGAAGVGF